MDTYEIIGNLVAGFGGFSIIAFVASVMAAALTQSKGEK